MTAREGVAAPRDGRREHLSRRVVITFMTAYREGPEDQRRELLDQRDTLIADPIAACSAPCRAELQALRRRLETAAADPIDHVREGLRLYEMTLEAGRAAGQQQGYRRRWGLAVVAATVGSLLAVIGGRIAYQYATHDLLVNPCPRGTEDGRRHLVIGHDGMLGLDFRCEALSDDDCRLPCSRHGACAAVVGRCVAREPAHCRESLVCAYHGECSLRGGVCRAASSDDCRKSEGCRVDGACWFDGARCTPRDNEDCKASVRCRDEGFCRFAFGGCEQEHDPAVDECSGTSHCLGVGLCELLQSGPCPSPMLW